MTDLTSQEEREMIEKAKAGDPEANYKMSFWALEQAAAEPGEERWNQLAAKCLVKAAQAGYEPAQKHMAQLLQALEEQEAGEQASGPKPELSVEEPTEEWVPASGGKPAAEKTASRRATPASGGAAGFAALGKSAAEKGKSLVQKAKNVISGLKDGSFGRGAAEWPAEKWKKIQIMCVIACIVLAFLIVLMLVTGKDTGKEAAEVAMPTPAAAEHVEVTPSPSPVPYPDEATKALIAAAELDIYPEDGDYVSKATTAVADVNSGLNLRSGPSSSYGQIVLMDADAKVEVYAVKNGWALVLYKGDTWGWCSDDYLTMN